MANTNKTLTLTLVSNKYGNGNVIDVISYLYSFYHLALEYKQQRGRFGLVSNTYIVIPHCYRIQF